MNDNEARMVLENLPRLLQMYEIPDEVRLELFELLRLEDVPILERATYLVARLAIRALSPSRANLSEVMADIQSVTDQQIDKIELISDDFHRDLFKDFSFRPATDADEAAREQVAYLLNHLAERE